MHGDELIPVTWHPRSVPLSPLGVAAREAAATRLARRLLQESADKLTRFRGDSAEGLMLILGPEELLPWVNDVVYLGRDEQSPSLWLPTNLKPSVPLSLLEASLIGRHAGVAPCAVLLNPHLIIPLTEARPLERKSLLKWLEADL